VRWREEEPTPYAADGAGEDDRADRAAADRVTRLVADAFPDGVVHVVGSRRMGCALPGADLDLVAVLPGSVELPSIRAKLAETLPEAAGMREVVGARVPGLRLRLDRLDVDLVVVATGTMDPGEAVARRAELGEAAAIALSAVSDAEAVLASAGAHGPAFVRLARQVKAWARARGLDSAPFGGLPGLAWSVLAARTASEAGDLPSTDLLRHFFATWAAWDWRDPVGLVAAPPRTGAPVTIMTPTAPVRSCTEQVGPGFRDLLTAELYRAWEIVESGADGLLSPPDAHRAHAAWALVTVPHDLVGPVRGRVRALLAGLEAAGTPDVHAWPRPVQRGPDAVRFAIGLGRRPVSAAELDDVVASWRSGLRGVDVVRVGNGDVPTLR
jgi:hypothetical protein